MFSTKRAQLQLSYQFGKFGDQAIPSYVRVEHLARLLGEIKVTEAAQDTDGTRSKGDQEHFEAEPTACAIYPPAGLSFLGDIPDCQRGEEKIKSGCDLFSGPGSKACLPFDLLVKYSFDFQQASEFFKIYQEPEKQTGGWKPSQQSQ